MVMVMETIALFMEPALKNEFSELNFPNHPDDHATI